MAVYRGIYINSLGKSFTNIRFAVTLNNTSNLTTIELDAQILPNIFVNHVEQTSLSCVLNFHRLRKAIIMLDINNIVYCPLPFQENTLEYNQFLLELGFNPLVKSIGLQEEIIKDEVIDLWLIR